MVAAHIFLSTAFPSDDYAKENTGDTDYTKTLEKNLQQHLGVDKVEYLVDINTDEQEVFKYIDQHTQEGEQKILHVMLNIPFTGCAFTPEGLKQFKENGGKLIITAIEFHNHRILGNLGKAYNYLSQADSIGFLDEEDKETAITYAQDYADKLDLSHLNNAQVIPVPATVPLSTVEPENRGGDILSFGIIRRGKRFDYIVKLAELIKHSNNPLIKDKKILVVGSLLKDSEQRFSEVSTLMEAIYPSKIDEIKGKLPSELALLLKQYQADHNLIHALPIELHVNVDKDKLPELFNKCTYSYLPAFRGATFGNSSISTSLANKFITYSHITHVTPQELKSEGKYADSIVLFDNLYTAEDGKYEQYVFNNILQREHDKSLNKQTWQAIDKVNDEMLSINKITAQHLEVYQSVSGLDLTKSLEINQPDIAADSPDERKETARKLASEEREKLFGEIISNISDKNASIISLKNLLDEKLVNDNIDNVCRDGIPITYVIAQCVRRPKAEQVFKLLLEYKPHINRVHNIRQQGSNTLLTNVASTSTNISVMELLLDHGADINKKVTGGFTALHAASQHGRLESVEFLLTKGAKITEKDIYGNTPLHLIASKIPSEYDIFAGRNYLGIADYLIKKEPSLITTRNLYSKTPLHIAAEKGSMPMLQLLLRHNARTNALDIENKFPLQLAIENGHVEIVKELLDFEKYPHMTTDITTIKNKSGKALIHSVAIGGNVEIYKFLMDKLESNKEMINAVDKNGRTPMHLAVQYGHKNMLKLIKEYGGNIDAKDLGGDTSLHLAARQGNSDIVQELIRLGANINIKNKVRETPLETFNTLVKEEKASNEKIQELFEGNKLIARITNIKDEFFYLHNIRYDGNYGNVERVGNRARSATLFLSQANNEILDSAETPTGILYNRDKTIVRKYMLVDAYTHTMDQGDVNFYNSLIDNSGLIATNSQKIMTDEEFYQEYAKGLDIDFDPVFKYNELIVNLYPKSIAGILVNSKFSGGKLQALQDKYYISEKYGYDLPMVLLGGGKVEVWNPDLAEIKVLLEETDKTNQLLAGLTLDENGEVTPLNKNEVTFKEFEYFLTENFSKDVSAKNYYKAKLLEVVNIRLQDDDLPTIDSLDNFLIHKKDTENFVNAVYQEKIANKSEYPIKNNKDLEEITNKALGFMQSNRPNKNDFPELNDYKSVRDILEKQSTKVMEETKKIETKLKLQQFFTENPSNKRKTNLELMTVEPIKKVRSL